MDVKLFVDGAQPACSSTGDFGIGITCATGNGDNGGTANLWAPAGGGHSQEMNRLLMAGTTAAWRTSRVRTAEREQVCLAPSGSGSRMDTPS